MCSDGFNVRGGLERNLKGGCGKAFCGGCFVVFFEGAALQHLSSGGCFDIFCGGYLDITWHLLESCFTAFLRAAFTAYFEAAFFAAFFRGSCFVAIFGGGCFVAFLGGLLCDIFEGDLERPLSSLHIKTITDHVTHSLAVPNCKWLIVHTVVHLKACRSLLTYLSNSMRKLLIKSQVNRHVKIIQKKFYNSLQYNTSKSSKWLLVKRIHNHLLHKYMNKSTNNWIVYRSRSASYLLNQKK